MHNQPKVKETFYCDGVWIVDRNTQSASLIAKKEDLEGCDLKLTGLLALNRGRLCDMVLSIWESPISAHDLVNALIVEMSNIELEHRMNKEEDA